MNKHIRENFFRRITFLIIFLGIFIRFSLAILYSVSGDACWQLSVSRFFAENGKLPLFENLGRQELFWAPPVFHIMAALFYKMLIPFGQNAGELGMKMISPIFGSSTIVFSYLVCKKLFNYKITFFSMLFIVFLPMSMDYGIISYIDGTVTFFVILSVYFALSNRYILAGFSSGIAALTKYNGIFVMPLIVYIVYRNNPNKRMLFKRLGIIIISATLIAAPWFARNFYNFGNPFWPFFSFISVPAISGNLPSPEGPFATIKLSNIFSINTLTYTYLAFFGVPEGNYKNLFFFKIPFLEALIALWMLGTIIFLLPLTRRFRIADKTVKWILIIWILCYASIVMLYIGNVRWNAARFFLPAIPALGMIYGNGLASLRLGKKGLGILYFCLLSAIIIGFIAAESFKITLSSKEWDFYKKDFEWVRQNTNEEELVMPGLQCLSYYLKRGTLPGAAENLKKADYIWANENFKVEPGAILRSDLMPKLNETEFRKIYENKKTGTSLYKASDIADS